MTPAALVPPRRRSNELSGAWTTTCLTALCVRLDRLEGESRSRGGGDGADGHPDDRALDPEDGRDDGSQHRADGGGQDLPVGELHTDDPLLRAITPSRGVRERTIRSPRRSDPGRRAENHRPNATGEFRCSVVPDIIQPVREGWLSGEPCSCITGCRPTFWQLGARATGVRTVAGARRTGGQSEAARTGEASRGRSSATS